MRQADFFSYKLQIVSYKGSTHFLDVKILKFLYFPGVRVDWKVLRWTCCPQQVFLNQHSKIATRLEL